MNSDLRLGEDNSSQTKQVQDEFSCPDKESTGEKFIDWGMKGFEDDDPTEVESEEDVIQETDDVNDSATKDEIIADLRELSEAASAIQTLANAQIEQLKEYYDFPLSNDSFLPNFTGKLVKLLRQLHEASAWAAQVQRHYGVYHPKAVPTVSFDGVITIRETEDALVVKSPNMAGKLRTKQTPKEAYYPWMKYVLPASRGEFKHDGFLDLYIIPVYPEGTSELRIIDCDNIDTKVICDSICLYQHIDDNGVRVRWIMSAACTNRIETSLYTIVTRRQEKPYSMEEILGILEGIYHSPN